MTALAALNRARAAWEMSQPQLTITGWAAMLDGLDAQRAGAALCVEPAKHSPPGASPGGLASQTHDGGGALPSKSALHRQGGAV